MLAIFRTRWHTFSPKLAVRPGLWQGTLRCVHTPAADKTAGRLLEEKRLRGTLFAIESTKLVSDAISQLIERRLGSLVVVEDDAVVGMVTARDLLRAMNQCNEMTEALDLSMEDIMVPASRMVFCGSDDIFSVLRGVITLKDIADAENATATGGKKNFMDKIVPRRGVPQGTKLKSAYETADHELLELDMGVCAYPHPFKEQESGEAISEDSHFTVTLRWPHIWGSQATYLGVADGVGSWREHKVDPAAFSQALMKSARQHIEARATRAIDGELPPKPGATLSQAWETVVQDKIIGSATACIAHLDHEHNQLAIANLGDSGLLVLRHLEAGKLGTLSRPSDGRIVAFRSTQQLHEFNRPYQLGYAPGSEDHFDKPGNGDFMRVPLYEDDVIIMATDGLFDNVEEGDIVRIVHEWEADKGTPDDLAKALADTALEYSLDQRRDSPFALLAKENDIMWGGGMPDDVTVIAAVARRQGTADHEDQE